jgi:hypothetical protein
VPSVLSTVRHNHSTALPYGGAAGLSAQLLVCSRNSSETLALILGAGPARSNTTECRMTLYVFQLATIFAYCLDVRLPHASRRRAGGFVVPIRQGSVICLVSLSNNRCGSNGPDDGRFYCQLPGAPQIRNVRSVTRPCLVGRKLS